MLRLFFLHGVAREDLTRIDQIVADAIYGFDQTFAASAICEAQAGLCGMRTEIKPRTGCDAGYVEQIAGKALTVRGDFTAVGIEVKSAFRFATQTESELSDCRYQ